MISPLSNGGALPFSIPNVNLFSFLFIDSPFCFHIERKIETDKEKKRDGESHLIVTEKEGER